LILAVNGTDWVAIIGALSAFAVAVIGAMAMLLGRLREAIVETKADISRQVTETKQQAAVANAGATEKLEQIHDLTNSTLTAATARIGVLEGALAALVAERSGVVGVAEGAAKRLIAGVDPGAMAQARKALGTGSPVPPPEPPPPKPA